MPSVILPMSMAFSVHLNWDCQGLCPPHQFELHLTQLCSIQLPLLAPQETLYILTFPALANMLLSYKRKPSVFQSLCPPYISLSIFLTVLYTERSLSHHDHKLCLRGPNESTSIHDVQSSPIPNANTLVWLGGSVNACRISPCTFSAHKTCTSTWGRKLNIST